MIEGIPSGCTAFAGTRLIAAGDLASVVVRVKEVIDSDERATILVFDNATSEPIEIDTRGTAEEMLRRMAGTPGGGASIAVAGPPGPAGPRGPGRPKLGVVAREITLLPRHWEWLNGQPGGASVALRKLVEEARHANAGRDRLRRAQESSYRFMSAMAGNEPGYEEAIRALFARNRNVFHGLVESWPADVRDHVNKLAAGTWP